MSSTAHACASRSLRRGADIGVVGTLWEDDLLVAEPFLENSLMCFCAPGHPLARP